MAPKQKTDRTIYSAKICHNAIGFPKWWNQVEQNKICKENSLQSGRFHQGSSHSSLLCWSNGRPSEANCWGPASFKRAKAPVSWWSFATAWLNKRVTSWAKVCQSFVRPFSRSRNDASYIFHSLSKSSRDSSSDKHDRWPEVSRWRFRTPVKWIQSSCMARSSEAFFKCSFHVYKWFSKAHSMGVRICCLACSLAVVLNRGLDAFCWNSSSNLATNSSRKYAKARLSSRSVVSKSKRVGLWIRLTKLSTSCLALSWKPAWPASAEPAPSNASLTAFLATSASSRRCSISWMVRQWSNCWPNWSNVSHTVVA